MSGLRRLGTSGLPLLRRAVAPKTVSVSGSIPSTARSFSILPSLRPTLQSARPVFRQLSSSPQQIFTPTSTATATAEGAVAVADLVPKTAISTNPALSGIASQIRCGPRPTMSNASRLIQKRRHGFLSRIRTNKGRKVLAARKAKGRRRLCA